MKTENVVLLIGIFAIVAMSWAVISSVMNNPTAQFSNSTGECVSFIDNTGTHPCPTDLKNRTYYKVWVE